MPSYIRPHSEDSVYLRALMKSALSLLNTTSASRAVSQTRVCESRSDLTYHPLEHTSHRTVGYCNFVASTSLLWLWRPPLCYGCEGSYLIKPWIIRPAYGPSLPCPLPPWYVPSQLFSSCSPRTLRLGSVTPRRSAHSYLPPLLLSDSILDARATPGSTGCDYPFSSAPSVASPGLRGSAACVDTYRLAY